MGGRPLLMAALPDNTLTAAEALVAAPARPMIDVILNCLDDAKAEETVAVDITAIAATLLVKFAPSLSMRVPSPP